MAPSLLALAGLLLVGAAPCPDEARVAEAVARSAPPEVRARHTWTIALTPDGMKLTLLDARGGVVRERVVPAPATCAERETVAAAVLSAWMVATPAAQLPAPAPPKPAPPRPAPTPSPPPQSAPQTPPIAAPEAPAPAPPEEPLKPAPAVEEPLPPPPPPPPMPETPPGAFRIELALDARAQLADSLAPGAGLTVSAGDRLQGFLELSSATARTLPLPPGQVRWFRVALGLGVRYRFDLRELYVEPAASVEGAWLRTEGQGFAQRNSVATGFDFSACGQLRSGRFFGESFGIYVGARGCAWPLPNRVGATGVEGTAPLPRFELSALLGVSAGFAVKGSSGVRPSEK